MRIAELSARSGRSIATIKYYVREGLLPPGRRTAGNQADYDDEHLHRLRLITTLVEVGRLPIATVRRVLTAIDDDSLSMHDVLGVAHRGLAVGGAEGVLSAPIDESQGEVDRFLEELGWRVEADAPAKIVLAGALASLRALGWRVGAEVFDRYAALADELAEWELARTPEGGPRSRTVEAVVVGTVVFEVALLALRRLAQEHHSAAKFDVPASRD